MSVLSLSSAIDAEGLRDEQRPAIGLSQMTAGRITLAIGLIIAIVIVCGIVLDMVAPAFIAKIVSQLPATALPIFVGTIVSLTISAMPVLISFVQTSARTRQLARLVSIRDQPAASSRYYQIAVKALEAIRPATLNSDYTLPMLTLASVVLFCCLMTFLGSFAGDAFKHESFVLGGIATLDMSDLDKVAVYQRGTFVCGTMAFIGAYIYMIGRLLDRLNNNDMYPISFYYYTARIVIAVFAAAVFRHSLNIFGVEQVQALVLLGFVTGLAPDLFITTMARRGFQMIKVAGAQQDPDASAMPTNLSLLMLEGMTREKIDRLNELGIDSAQMLACQNPFVIWPRLPYDLGLIIDWIAQAQLYAMVKETALVALRKNGINRIFDLYIALSDEAARKDVCEMLNIPMSLASVVLKQMDQDQSFRRLSEVRERLIPKP